MAEENQEDNKKVAKDIGDSLGDTLKKAFSNFNKSQDPEWEGVFTRQKTLHKNIEQLSKTLTTIQDSIHKAFPKIIESIKSSLSPPASKPSAGVTTPEVIVSADSPAPKDAPSKDNAPSWMEKIDGPSGILGLFGIGLEKEETKDSTPEVIKESNASIVDTLKERFGTLSSVVSTLAGTPAPTPEGAPRTEATAPPIDVTVDAPGVADADSETTTTIESTSKTIVETLKERFNTLSSAISTLAGAPAPTPEGTPRTVATAPPIDVTVDAPDVADAPAATGAETTEAIEESNSSLASMISTIRETSGKMTDSLQTGFYNASHWLEKVDSSSEAESEASTQTIADRLKETASSTMNSLSSVFTKQSDDVEGSIQEQTEISQDMASADEEGKATEEVMKVESDREKATADSEQMQILRDIRDSLKGSFGAVSKDKKKGGFLAGLLGGIGAGIGAIAKGVAKIGVGFGKGMIALGVGIAGFMLAIGATSVILGLMGADGKALKTIIGNFFGAFDTKSATMMGGLIAIAVIMAKLKVGAKQMAFGMGSLGAGIGGFFLAIGAASWLADAAGLNGVALANLIRTFFGAFDAKAAVMMGGIVAVAAIAAKLQVNEIKLAAGMTAIGFGLAGFFGGIIAADFIADIAVAKGIDGTALKTLMGNFFGIFDDKAKMATLAAVLGIGALAGITGGGLKIFAGMTAVGMGLAGFFGGIILADAGASIAAGIGGGLDGKALKTLMNNFFDIFDSKEKVTTLSAVLGVGALTGIIGGPKAAAGIFAGMTAMGAGLAGFFGGILMADWLANIGTAEGINGASLAVLIKNFVDAFSSSGTTGVALLSAIMGVGAIVGIVGAAVPGVGAAVIAGGIFAGMTALGAGLVGFFGGIMLADHLTAIFGVDGSGIAGLIENFLGAFKSKKDIATLAILLAAAGAASFNPLGVAAGMTAIGAGLVGFFGAFALGGKLTEMLSIDVTKVKTFMGEVGEGIGRFVGGMAGGVAKQLEDINPERLEALGRGIKGIGIGIAAFAAGEAVGAIGGVMGALTGFFGVKSPIDKILDIAARTDIDATRLAALGDAIGPLGKGLAAFSGLDLSGGAGFMKAMIGQGDAFGLFFKSIAKLGKIDDEDMPDADKIRKLGDAIKPLGEGIKGFSGVDMDAIVDTKLWGKPSLEIFFDMLGSDKLKLVASKSELENVGGGIAAMGKAVSTFSGIDMGTIVGNNWTPGKETSFESFLNGVGGATEKIKDPDKLERVADSLSVLGTAMQAFKGIDGSKIDFSRFFISLETGNPERMKKNLEMLKWIKTKDTGGAGGVEAVTPSIDVSTTSKALGGKTTKEPYVRNSSKEPRQPKEGEIIRAVPEGEFKGKDQWVGRVSGPKDLQESFFYQEESRQILAKGLVPPPEMHTGGIVPVDGPIIAQGGEFILDQQAAQVFMKAATLLTGSQALEQSRAGDGGPPVIINQVDNSQANPVISNQATQIKTSESPHASESTKTMLDQAYAMG